MYLVDVVFGHSNGAQGRLFIQEPMTFYGKVFRPRQLTAGIVALLFVIPAVFLHFLNLVKVQMNLSGISQTFLQTNLFRKYLNYTDLERQKVAPSEMALAILQDCAEC